MPTTATFHAFTDTRAARSLRNYVEGLSDPTLLVSSAGGLLYANAGARTRFSGAAPAYGDAFRDFVGRAFPDARWDHVEPCLQALLDDPESEPATVFLDDGAARVQMRVAPLEVPVSPDDSTAVRPESEIVLACTFFAPDSDTWLRRLEFVLDASTDGVFLVNRTNHIVYFNKAAEKITGWRRGAAVMQTYECANVMKCHNEAGESLGAEPLCPAKVFFQRDATPKPHEMLITTTDGRERWIETNYSPIRAPGGEVEYIVGIIRDIHERKRLESQLVQSRNLAALGQLVSGLAHEIRNPLGILMSGVEIVLDAGRAESDRREAAGFIKDEIRRLDGRMKDFLAFARPRPARMEPVGLNATLANTLACHAVARHPAVAVDTLFDDRLPDTLGDPDMLHRLFLNLALNAEQALAPAGGGRMTVTTELLGGDDPENQEIRIAFSDDGPGIPEADLARVFDPFFTTKPDGTGLGLCMTHQAATAHRGRVVARNNTPAPGVTLEVTIPVTPAADHDV